MQFLNRKVSVLDIFYVSNISRNLCFLTFSLCASYETAGSGVAQGHFFFSKATMKVMLSVIQNKVFLTFRPLTLKIVKAVGKKTVLMHFLKIIKICQYKNGDRGSLKNPLINLISQSLIFIQIFGKGLLNHVTVTNKVLRIGPTILKTSLLKIIFLNSRLQQVLNNMVNVSFVRLVTQRKSKDVFF